MKNIKTDYYSKHFIALSALFLLGNAVIGLPAKNADKYTFSALLISVLLSLALCFLIFFFKFSKPFKIIAFLLSFWAAGDTFLEFIQFISTALLPEIPKIFVILPFVFTAVYFCFKKTEVIFKFSLVSFAFSALSIVFFFCFTFKDFNFENIIIRSLPTAKNLLLQTLPYLKGVTLPSVLVCFFAKITQKPQKTALCGVALGGVCLGFCILNSVLLFGAEFSGALSYPYAQAISTVTLGNLFTRMDGFAYFIYFSSCLVKITVCVNIIKQSIKT